MQDREPAVSPHVPYTTLFRSPCSISANIGLTARRSSDRSAMITSAASPPASPNPGTIALSAPRRGSAGEHGGPVRRSEEHTSELQSPHEHACRPLPEKKLAKN